MNRREERALPEFLRGSGRGEWLLAVWVQPGAKKNEIAEMYQGSVKIRLGAPAVDNKANKALTAFVADRLGLKKRQVSLLSGHASRKKTLRIQSDTEPDWDRLFPDRLSSNP